jgi:phosphoadenosine phosphosulfate reductase
MQFSQEELRQINSSLEREDPIESLEWVMETFPINRAGLATAFGAEGVILIDMVVKLNRHNNDFTIFYIDTDLLFPETYQLRDQLEQRYQIKFVRYSSPLTVVEQNNVYGKRLWQSDPDQCCNIRKIQPLKAALKNFSVWVTAIRREQSPDRAKINIVEWDEKFGLYKVNPLASWTKKDVWNYIVSKNIPYNPLYDQQYTSIGCTHCTTPVALGEDERAGRWRGFHKTECGLHTLNRNDGASANGIALNRNR